MDLKGDLLEIIEHQEQIIAKQNDIIIELVHENSEQENIVNVMMAEQVEG